MLTATRGEGGKLEPSRCESRRRQLVQPVAQHRSTHRSHAVNPSRRPAHALALGHPRVGNLVDRAVGARARDRSRGPVTGAAVDERTVVVGQVGT